MKNPFKFGKEVSGYQFYDRQDATHSLLRKLRDGSTNVVLFAPRRYGKTSLVHKVIEQLSHTDGICGLCFDMTRVPTVERFCEEYANAVYAMFGGRKELVHKLMDYLSHLHPTFSISGEVKLDYGTKMSATSIAEVLDLPEKLAHDMGNKPIVVAFDEFQDVAELSKEFPLEKIFRSCIQAHKNVRYVFLGSKTHLMKRMFGDATRPFYNSALPMPLPKPPESESIGFLISRFRDAGLLLSPENAQSILAASENIPYYLQAIASLAFECSTDKDHTEVLPSDISAAIEAFIGINAELYDERLHGISDAKRALLEALAREPVAKFDEAYRNRHRLPVTSTLHTALGELVDAGLVDRTPTEIRLADPLFARSIRGNSATVFTA